MLFVMSCIFSSSFGFGIVWNKTNDEQTSLQIYDYNGEQLITSKTIETSIMQEICLVRFSSNKGGIHTISYKATPLICGSLKAGYVLYFTNNGTSTELDVGVEADIYPTDSTVASIINIPFGKGTVSSDILITGIVDKLDSAGPGEYSATITIERISL